MSTKEIQVLCPQTGLIKTVTVCSEQTVGAMLGELGWTGTLYLQGRPVDPESTFVGRPHDPSLLGKESIEMEPYSFGPRG
jgi:hypothetical protein